MRKCKKESGQVVTEYVIVLIMIVLIAFSLTALNKAVCDQGERMVRVASYNVP
ncbi:MAG: hypothetical protein IKA32_08810 [Lentisphaeria bacterium]|nr:hypothetical protein [Lentisphaeria bacterium]